MKRWVVAVALLLPAWPALAAATASSERQAEAERRLQALRAELQELNNQQQSLLGSRQSASHRLRASEQAIASQQRALQTLQAAIAEGQRALAELESRQSELQLTLERQRGALALLVRSLYALGRYEQLRLLLAQDSIETLHRRLIYHRYLQRDRLGQVTASLTTLRELAATRSELEQTASTLAQQHAEQQQRLPQLQQQRQARQQLLAELEQRYQQQADRLRELARDEQQLLGVLESLRDIFADIPRDAGQQAGLAPLRGRLPRPAQGRLRVGYAGTLPDGRASHGWWIEAAGGSEVRSIAAGRVAFADWMKGYGLILIVEHGDGFMSLYAGVDALLADAGDWLEAGQPLALAGSSGGFAAAGVYFELRRAGRPLDPASWLQRP